MMHITIQKTIIGSKAISLREEHRSTIFDSERINYLLPTYRDGTIPIKRDSKLKLNVEIESENQTWLFGIIKKKNKCRCISAKYGEIYVDFTTENFHDAIHKIPPDVAFFIDYCSWIKYKDVIENYALTELQENIFELQAEVKVRIISEI